MTNLTFLIILIDFIFTTAFLLRFTPIFSLPDEGLDCLTYSANLKRCVTS